MVHLVVLGGVLTSIVRWSGYFAQALLKTELRPGTDKLSWPLAGAIALVIAGVVSGWWPLTLVAGTALTVIVGVHGWALVGALRRALPGRFRAGLHYYLAAIASLAVGVGFGITLAYGHDEVWHARLLLAHTLTNLVGFVALSVLGTLLTLWPTILRVGADPSADAAARRALPVLLAGLVVTDAGALAGWTPLGIAGLAFVVAGFGLHVPGLVRIARVARDQDAVRPGFAAASVAAGVAWFVAALVATAGVWLWAPGPRALADAYPWLVSMWVVGFALQVLLGALSFLLPAVLGGGPRVAAAGGAEFDRWASFRLAVINLGLLAWLVLRVPWARVAVSMLGLAVLLSFLPLMMRGLRASVAALKEQRMGRVPAPVDTAGTRTRPPAPPLSRAGVGAGVVALVTAVLVGIAVDPAAAGLPLTGRSASGQASGKVVRVAVTMRDMRFVPNRIEASAGDRVIVDLTNADVMPHDLQLAGVRTDLVKPGESATLEAGVVTASQQGWCTVVGHRQMGMTLDLVVNGAAASGTTGMAGMDGSAAAASGVIAPHLDVPLTSTVDAATAPDPARIHRVTLTMTEVPLEVAPGVWQQRWTYNGRPVGPTLRGHVGDEFVVTLVNDGSMGHSIDFHAGDVSPDAPMRTIAPGQSLEYRFIAKRAGIWMYHCSTMPMSSHIAAGMAGAVIIDPPGLPAVDHEYVLVGSEIYLASQGQDAASAAPVNPDAIAAGTPSYVTFNGIARQYDQHQLVAKAGQRVRFWVLDTGPNRPLSFHVVGAQFDTVYREGAYQLRHGVDAFGQAGGGAQALALQPAEGGFVETTIAEAGHYPFVSHVMSDAERGAHGVLNVTP